MPDVLDVYATARPEGGAAVLTFGLSDDATTVRILRAPQGAPTPPHDDPNAPVVFDGPPVPADVDNRFHRAHPEPQARYEAWDLEAFTERFSDAPNEIDGITWDYHLYALDAIGNASSATTATISVARSVHVDFALNVKEIAYQRARYHARGLGGGLFAAKLEHLHNQPPPQLLVKARYQHLDTHISELAVPDGAQASTTFRGIVEALLITTNPDERDDLGDQLAARFLGDLHLLGELGWEGVTLAWQDGMATFADVPHYTRTFTLDGLVGAYLTRDPAVPIADTVAEWRAFAD